jgi:hypothetical protein
MDSSVSNKLNYVAIDFDGTVVSHEFPAIGKDVGALPIINKLISKGVKIILYTVRGGEYLQAAVEWYKERGIELFGVNENPDQHSWTDSKKPYAELFIDDAAAGAPLIKDDSCKLPYIDWKWIEKYLEGIGAIDPDEILPDWYQESRGQIMNQ